MSPAFLSWASERLELPLSIIVKILRGAGAGEGGTEDEEVGFEYIKSETSIRHASEMLSKQ